MPSVSPTCPVGLRLQDNCNYLLTETPQPVSLQASIEAGAKCLIKAVQAGDAATVQSLLAAGSLAVAPSSSMLHTFAADARMAALLQAHPAAQQPQPAPCSPDEVLQEYLDSLGRLATAEAAVANRSTLRAASSVADELSAWLAARSTARGGVGLHNCTPEDVVVFLETTWLPNHGTTLLADGQLHAAPSYLDSTISHLSAAFQRLGRHGEYSHEQQVGVHVPLL